MKKIVLPEYQGYLRSNSLVQEKYIRFFAHWAREFLTFSKSNSTLNHVLVDQEFIDYLKSRKKNANWQLKQASFDILVLDI